ncbi:MAG: transcription termination/antitermination protein NusG [Gemmatimonadetes bacterium]|nr:transcription termination/antitermination protein NusG [Gemmatimonadota bacterium]
MVAFNPVPEPEPRWYAVQALSSKENRVLHLIETLIDEERLSAEEDDREPEILRALVPTYETIQMRNQKRVTVTKRSYPGYVLVELLTYFDGEDSHTNEKIRPYLKEYTVHLVNSIAGVLRFVGPQPLNPRPLAEEEINRILGTGEEAEEERARVPFRTEEAVEVTDGPFNGFSGVVNEVDHDKGRVRVEVSIFGRPTTVDLEYTQLKKLA